MTRSFRHAIALTAALAVVATVFAQSASPVGQAYRVAKVVTMDDHDTVINDAVVLVDHGRITAVGTSSQIQIPSGYVVHEFPEAWLVPGLVDCHNHTAAGLSDLNDMVYQTNPGLDTRTAIHADNQLIRHARAGGVTTVLTIPGSGTNLSGFGTIAKTGGRSPDDMIIRSPGSLKVAQAGNPEWYFGGNWRRYMNWNTRETLEHARDYDRRWREYEQSGGPQPEKSIFYEDFRGLFAHEYPASVHTQQYQVLMATILMLYDHFDLWVVLDHCTFDAWKLGPLVAEREARMWAINGPRQFHFDRTARRMIGNAAGWWKNGVRKLGINTDAPVVPQAELTFQAAMACWYGWLPYPALRGVTRVPADALGVSDHTGSIETGKDADFGVWTGDPIDPRSSVLLTVVNGVVEYDAAAGPRPF